MAAGDIGQRGCARRRPSLITLGRGFDSRRLHHSFALMVFPYFVSSAWAVFLIGALLMTIPFCFRG